MMRALFVAAIAVSAVLTSPVAAQVTPNAPAHQAQNQPTPLVIPARKSCRSPWAKVERVKSVDIPQWAKDEGHNGRATYSATVGADGELIGLELVKSSGSSAIDEAVKQRAQTLDYSPAINQECNPIEGKVRVWMEYGRFDTDSPGGGLDGYTCGHMIREFDWFVAAPADSNALFIPRFAYLIAGGLARLEQGEDLDGAMIDAETQERIGMWETLVERCRAAPETPLLDEIDHPEMFRRQVDSR